jgi:uncharacterized protein
MHPALLIAIALFALLGHGYFWIAIVNRLHGWAGPHRLIDVLTLGGLLSFLILPPLVVWQWRQGGWTFFTDPYLPAVGEPARIYIIGTAFFGFGKLLAKLIGGWESDDPRAVVAKSRRIIEPPESPHLLCGPYARLLSNVPGNQVLQLAVENKRLAIPRLPDGLVGFRIAHASDWHLTGRIDREWFEHVADAVNSSDPDVIMITGDIIEKDACRPWLADCFGRLRPKFGTYFVLGNHDYYIDAQRTIEQLEELGLSYAGGRRLKVAWNGVPISIVGNESPWNCQLPDCSPDESSFGIALLHTPDQFDWACLNYADLALAGHTHGGQVCFPILGAVAAPSLYGTQLAGGTFRRGKTIIHVTRGISGETPMRWFCPPEIAILELTKAEV